MLFEKNQAIVKSYKLYRPIRENAYRFLMSSLMKFRNPNNNSNQTNMSDIHVDEIYFDINKNDRIHTSIKIEPLGEIYKDFDLEQYWCDKCKTDEERMDLLIDCASLTDQKNDLIYKHTNRYPKEYFVPCAVLRYMLKYANLLTHSDIKAFVCTFVSKHLYEERYLEYLKVSS